MSDDGSTLDIRVLKTPEDIDREKAIARAMSPRNDEQIISGQLGDPSGGEGVTMGGKEYTIYPKKGRRHTRAFKKRVEPILLKLTSVSGLLKDLAATNSIDFKKIDDAILCSVTGLAKQFLTTEFDDLLDVVYEWSDEINEDRETLEDTASDEEFIAVLVIISKMVYGPLLKSFQLLGKGIK